MLVRWNESRNPRWSDLAGISVDALAGRRSGR